VTAETAVALPAIVLFTALLLWGVLAAAAQIECVDAARLGARAAARGDTDATAMTAARRAAPRGAEVSVVRGTDTVRVAVAAPLHGPGGLTRGLTVRVSAEAFAAREDLPLEQPLGGPSDGRG
jgi:hypothetical protein